MKIQQGDGLSARRDSEAVSVWERISRRLRTRLKLIECGLDRLLHQPLGTLSKGERKRVLLAIGLMTPQPAILSVFAAFGRIPPPGCWDASALWNLMDASKQTGVYFTRNNHPPVYRKNSWAGGRPKRLTLSPKNHSPRRSGEEQEWVMGTALYG